MSTDNDTIKELLEQNRRLQEQITQLLNKTVQQPIKETSSKNYFDPKQTEESIKRQLIAIFSFFDKQKQPQEKILFFLEIVKFVNLYFKPDPIIDELNTIEEYYKDQIDFPRQIYDNRFIEAIIYLQKKTKDSARNLVVKPIIEVPSDIRNNLPVGVYPLCVIDDKTIMLCTTKTSPQEIIQLKKHLQDTNKEYSIVLSSSRFIDPNFEKIYNIAAIIEQFNIPIKDPLFIQKIDTILTTNPDIKEEAEKFQSNKKLDEVKERLEKDGYKSISKEYISIQELTYGQFFTDYYNELPQYVLDDLADIMVLLYNFK